MPRGFSLLLTGTQAADRLGVSVQCVLHWAAEGRLPIAGQDEDGRALFREHVIETIGEELVAARPADDCRPRKIRATSNEQARRLGDQRARNPSAARQRHRDVQ